MERRKLGKSDVEVSAIAFGAWAIGGWQWGGADQKDAIKAIEACPDFGITTIDTAPVYGFGLSETLVGKAVKGQRDKFEILTKYGLKWDQSVGEFFFITENNEGKPINIHKYSGYKSIIKECEDSLKRLGTDYIDLYQIHWPDGTTPIEESMKAVGLLLEQGKIRAAGVSNYTVDQMEEAAAIIPLSTNQVPYSMVRRDIEKDVAPWCIENECSILAYSPLQRGLLTGKITPDYRFNPGDTRPETAHFKINNIIRTNDLLNKIKPIADRQGKTLTQLVIKWTILQPGITVALTGGRDPEQVEENAAAADVELKEDDLQFIRSELNNLDLEL